MNPSVAIYDTPEHGTVLACSDLELADEFEDYITERCYVLFTTKMDRTSVLFHFGQASSSAKVRELFDKFSQQRVSK